MLPAGPPGAGEHGQRARRRDEHVDDADGVAEPRLAHDGGGTGMNHDLHHAVDLAARERQQPVAERGDEPQ